MNRTRSALCSFVLLAACGDPPEVEEMDAGPPDAGGRRAVCLTGAGAAVIGDHCGCGEDCAPGLVCAAEEAEGWPQGTCTRVCATAADECGEGNVCYGQEQVPGAGLCRLACSAHEDCPSAWLCFYGVCNPFCGADAECLSGHCNPYNRLCDDGAPPAGGGLMAQCTRDDECRSGACLTAIGGHCMSFCGREDCPDGGICIEGIDSADPTVGVCMTPCTTTADCPGQLECLRAGGGRRACWIRSGP